MSTSTNISLLSLVPHANLISEWNDSPSKADFEEAVADSCSALTKVQRMVKAHLDGVSAKGQKDTLPSTVRGTEILSALSKPLDDFIATSVDKSSIASYKTLPGDVVRALPTLKTIIQRYVEAEDEGIFSTGEEPTARELMQSFDRLYVAASGAGESAAVKWKGYMEGYTQGCDAVATALA